MTSLERAADMLTAYGEMIRRGGARELDEHHYLPEVEETARSLRNSREGQVDQDRTGYEAEEPASRGLMMSIVAAVPAAAAVTVGWRYDALGAGLWCALAVCWVVVVGFGSGFFEKLERALAMRRSETERVTGGLASTVAQWVRLEIVMRPFRTIKVTSVLGIPVVVFAVGADQLGMLQGAACGVLAFLATVTVGYSSAMSEHERMASRGDVA